MTSSPPADIVVLGHGLEAATVRALMRGRPRFTRTRRLLGRDVATRVGETVYWPVAVIEATARDTGRRGWVDRVQGAVDLVTGRVGLVDRDLPDVHTVAAAGLVLVEGQVPRRLAELRWHEFFRDHIDRRRKPFRPPALSLDRITRVYLPGHLATADKKAYLVDALTRRVDDLSSYPSIEGMLVDRERALRA